jgi:hypothetical protein
VLSGARDLVRITKGKGIVLSSGAAGWGSARGVQDVINLFVLPLALSSLAIQSRTICSTFVLYTDAGSSLFLPFPLVVAHLWG